MSRCAGRANLALSYFLIASRRKTITAPNSSAAARTIPVIAAPLPGSIETHLEDTPPTGRFPDSGRAGRVPRGRGKKGTDQAHPARREAGQREPSPALRPGATRDSLTDVQSPGLTRQCAPQR